MKIEINTELKIDMRNVLEELEQMDVHTLTKIVAKMQLYSAIAETVICGTKSRQEMRELVEHAMKMEAIEIANKINDSTNSINFEKIFGSKGDIS